MQVDGLSFVVLLFVMVVERGATNHQKKNLQKRFEI